VEISAGRISAIHDRPGPVTCDLGNAAIIPGLVNAHTHLELSDAPAPLLPASPFTAWLKQVMAHRLARGAASESAPSPVVRGREESARCGTTTLGDIAGQPAAATEGHDALPGPRTVAFLELLGLAPERTGPQLQRAADHVAAKTSSLPGLSPHAPYSVHPDLLRGAVDLAVKHRVPVAMHLAETRAELELLATGTGEFVPFLEALGAWRPDAIPRGSRPLDYLRELSRAECALVVHGNYLDDVEIDYLASHPNLTVVYCPRTHAFFGHDPHPWRGLLARGINLAVGTDSRASNPDLSLFAELQFLRQLAPDLDPSELLQVGTFNGAFALGLEHETGSLATGKSADLAIVNLAGDETDPYALLFHPESRVGLTLCAGRNEA
jgi:cytosine/adenosine deaminase-related metal-dependent hydrolase